MELVLIDSHDTVGVPRKIDRMKFKPVIPPLRLVDARLGYIDRAQL